MLANCEHFGYEVLSILSSTSSTIVYKARDAKSSFVAIKEAKTTMAMKQAANEVAILSKVKHENIINIISSTTTPNQSTFLFLPLCEYGDLYHLLVSQSQPTPSLQLTASLRRLIFFQISQAVHHIHSLGIVHRDIKIDNILITSLAPLTILLSDFGLSHPVSQPPLNALLGSDSYISPELFTHYHDSSFPVDFKLVDCWAVGVVLYAVMTGCMPFGGGDRKKMWHRIARGEWRRDCVEDEGVRECCEGLLKVRVADRWTMSDVLVSKITKSR